MNDKPKLLVVSDTYHPLVDGTVRFIDEFVKKAKDEFNISLLVPKFSGEINKNTKTNYLPVSKWLKPLPTYPSIKVSWGNLRKIKRAVKNSELVFVQGPALATLLSIYYARRLKKKVVQYVHVLPWELTEFTKNKLISKYLGRLVKILYFHFYNKCDEIIVPYNGLLEQLKQKGVKTKMVVAKLGIDINKFNLTNDKKGWKKRAKLPEDSFVIGYVGRVSKEKNIEVLLDAVKKIKDKKGLRLLIVGDGPKEETKKCLKLPNCSVTGFVDNVESYLKAMDVFVMPSLTETTSLATLEAMSSGLPVIASKVGYIKKYINKEYNGLFFPRSSSSLLKAKIEKLRDDAELRDSLGKNARKTIAYSFSWERSINRIKRILLSKLYE